MTRQEQKAAAFRPLHAAEPFVIPNPWDPGSARMLEALATTSSGFAFTLGRRDGKGPRGVTDRMRDQEHIASVSDTEAVSREPELLADVERREKRCGGSSALASSADTCPLQSCRNVPAGFTTMPGGLSAHETASRRNRV